MFKKLIFIAALLQYTQTFAWFCPNNFNLIQPGDTLEKIKRECGKPLSEKSSKEDAKVPQEWGYYVAVSPPNPATVKMTVVFSADGILNNISVNSMSLTSTGICGGTISVGNTMQMVKAVCGTPPFINKGQSAQGSDKQVAVTELIYSGPQPNILVFESGILQSRR